MVKNILVATDGSDYSKTALEYGIYIAKRLDARLTVLHVVDIRIIESPLFGDISGSVGLLPYQEFVPVIKESLNERADSILETSRERCEKSGLNPELKKVWGIVNEAIVEEGENADWILLAQRGEYSHLSKGGLLGSTSEAVVRKSRKPVLVTPISFQEIESMGLAYDGSESADNALKIAAELCDKIRWPLSIIIITDESKQAADFSKRIEEILDPYEEIDSDIVILRGKVEQEIIKFIQEGSVELMVMGARGHSRFRELILGSTTSYVIRKSTIPILMVR
ncbi:MAG: universal stress protein [Syntrophales bacterium]|nr:universal stress protein [Syntrophales bacterium]